MFFPSVPALLWPVTPDISLARWWWTILLTRQAVSRSSAAASATPASVSAADETPAAPENSAPVSRKRKA